METDGNDDDNEQMTYSYILCWALKPFRPFTFGALSVRVSCGTIRLRYCFHMYSAHFLLHGLASFLITLSREQFGLVLMEYYLLFRLHVLLSAFSMLIIPIRFSFLSLILIVVVGMFLQTLWPLRREG
ncbi:hypothetical protein BDW62DRAFT_157304 [Aspergillus aurantiobrunneus]